MERNGGGQIPKYYGVERSSEYLAHYGVKGMRWGVRKALEKGNMKKLANHYQKSLIKNAKLRERANQKAERENAKASAAGGAALLGLGALSGLASYGMIKGSERASAAMNKAFNGYDDGHRLYAYSPQLIGLSAISTGGGLASLGSAAASAYRSTKKGHKRAVAKYNRFNSEMKKTFTKPMRKKINKFIKENPEYDWFEGRRYRRG